MRQGEKCNRCWIYSETIGVKHGASDHLCAMPGESLTGHGDDAVMSGVIRSEGRGLQKKNVLMLAIAGLVILLDQLTKAWIIDDDAPP